MLSGNLPGTIERLYRLITVECVAPSVLEGAMDIVRPHHPFPTRVKKTLFLAGPTPRDPSVIGWREEAIRLLQDLGYDGHVFNPEPLNLSGLNADGSGTTPSSEAYRAQVDWEEEALRRSDVIVFWVPRSEILPGLTTNTEFGAWRKSGKLVWGSPPGTPSVKYQKHHCVREHIPCFNDLKQTLQAALSFVGEGYDRIGALTQLPSFILKRADFQQWHTNLVLAGNNLETVNLEWSFWSGPGKKRSFIHVLSAGVFLPGEARSKTNEILILRPDISSVVLHCPQLRKVVLVAEYRLPVSNTAGLVYELPGGSSWTDESARQVAQSEVSEEVGIHLLQSRFISHGTRQLNATLSVHRCHLFSVELSVEELQSITDQEGPRGNLEDSERTYPLVMDYDHALSHPHVDWGMRGALAAVLTP